MALIRIDKYLADMGIGTRSQVKDLIKKGSIKVDGQAVKKPEIKVDTVTAAVEVNGKTVGYEEYEYFMLNKPAGVLSAASDKKAKTVVDLIETKKRKDMFPVGRLDKDTEGLLIITNDGEMAHNLLSPSKHVDKVYYAKVSGRMTEKEIDAFANGLVINKDFTARPAKLEIIRADDEFSEVYVTVHEGKFHQVKKMFIACDSEVLYLKRVSFGKLKLDETLEPGMYKKLSDEEIDTLKNQRMENL